MAITTDYLTTELANVKNQISLFDLTHNFDFSDFYVESERNELLNKLSRIEIALNNLNQ